MIFFWSDPHFNHEGIISLCNRPYACVEEMNHALEKLWNDTVGPKDTIYLLGDFGFSHSKREPLKDIFARLAGYKHLVVGNHDRKNKEVLKLGWESVNDLLTIKHEGARAEACHYPLQSWNAMGRGAFHVHGHSHGGMVRMNRRFDVGVDVFTTGPVSFGVLAALSALSVPMETFDHHGGMDL